MPRPKATKAHHERAGNYRKSRHGSPELATEVPPIPAMSVEAKKAWNSLTPLLVEAGAIAKVDQMALQALCESWAIYVKCQNDIDKKGILVTVTGRLGQKSKAKNPAIQIRNEAWKQVYDMTKQFGMTPVSRTGLQPRDKGRTRDISDILGLSKN